MADGTLLQLAPGGQVSEILAQDAAHRSETPPESDQAPAAAGRLANQLTLILFAVLITTTSIAVAVTGLHLQREHVRLMQSGVKTLGMNLKTLMEDVLALGLPLGALEGIDKELEKTVNGDSYVVYVNIVDQDAKILYSFPPLKEETIFHQRHIVPLIESDEPTIFMTDSSYNSFTPIHDLSLDRVVGAINIGVLKKAILGQTIETLATVLGTFTVFILVTLFLVRLLTTRAIKPLEVLTGAAMSLARGDLAARVSVSANNEIGSMANSFNFMASQLEQDHSKLLTYNQELEVNNHKLRQAHQEILEREQKLRDAQTQLVLNEKMASLGLLIAGIAHEINTPAGAIANVASDLSDRARLILENLPKISELSTDEIELLRSLLHHFIEGARVVETTGSWRQGRELRKWLCESGVEDAKQVADTLLKYNLVVRDQMVPYVTLLQKPWVLELADSLGTIHVGMEICASSITKISQIVKALKYYAYTDMDKTSLVDINENIENALMLMHNKLKYTTQVKREMSQLPRIQCTSELNQVWTNLINNAHDAIIEAHGNDNLGEITIATDVTDQWVRVEIRDNGIGVPQDKMTNIFDPFFTTKGIGKGTGLGLSIVSGIVKKHDGTIEVESAPGSSTFRVLLPKPVEEKGDHRGS